MGTEPTGFWEDLRSELHNLCGQQPGRRDRVKAGRRDTLAKECGISPHTIKGFMNRHQQTLPFEVMSRLMPLVPGFEERYAAERGKETDAGGAEQYIQLALQFDGFDAQREIVLSIPPGREGLLQMRLITRRLA